MKKTYILYLLLAALFVACTENFDDYNIDKKNPGEVVGNALFTSAQLALIDQISTPNVNLNVFRLFAQYWTETTYTDEANYDLVNRTIPDNTFQAYYRDVIKDLNEAARLIALEETPLPGDPVIIQNRLSIIELLTVYSFQNLVDIFGDVPYNESIDLEKVLPVYDDAFTIYGDLIDRVTAALALLDDSEGSFGDADIVYGGDIASWIKFGNSLKLKLGITIADHDAALAEATIVSAIGGIFGSNADNALVSYLSAPPNSNPIYDELILTGRKDFVGANTLIDILNGLADPRLVAYFTLTDTSTESGVEKLAYSGGPYGESPYALYSHVADPILAATFPGIMLTYDEILFYLAEAAERGFAVPLTAEAYYNAAITASFDFWDVTDVATYLAKPEVAYTTATGTWRQKIGTQAWIAFYTRGLEGFTEWRRMDYPVLNISPDAITEDGAVPVRFTYPINEQTLNPDNYTAAAAAIGGDELSTKIFWDIY